MTVLDFGITLRQKKRENEEKESIQIVQLAVSAIVCCDVGFRGSVGGHRGPGQGVGVGSHFSWDRYHCVVWLASVASFSWALERVDVATDKTEGEVYDGVFGALGCYRIGSYSRVVFIESSHGVWRFSR